jgi:hypothetical protein
MRGRPPPSKPGRSPPLFHPRGFIVSALDITEADVEVVERKSSMG